MTQQETEKSTHTPGPWRVIKSQLGDHTICAGRDDLAYLYIGDGGDEPKTFPVEANAHLIAAAPELLAALKSIRPLLNTIPESAPWNSYRAAIDAAIAKAEGR